MKSLDLNAVYTALMTTDIDEKTHLINDLYEAAQQQRLLIEGDEPVAIHQPPLPDNVSLATPNKMKHRGLGSKAGHQAMLHAIAHIEYNAINLGLDAVYRFRGMPDDFYLDWWLISFLRSEKANCQIGKIFEQQEVFLKMFLYLEKNFNNYKKNILT